MSDWTSLERLAAYDFDGKLEQAVREEWIQPLLRHLGYGETSLSEIRYEAQLRLARPIRLLGSSRYRVDYLPTVCRRSFWVLEAKAPTAESSGEDHLGQAWSYATHPEVNVPLMAIADGTRFQVFDVTKVDWDVPIVDIAAHELGSRFHELSDVLGARAVARTVRARTLHHLRSAMEAELETEQLDEVVAEVRRLATAARPAVEANRSAIQSDERDRQTREQARLRKSAGLHGIAEEVNEPFGFSTTNVQEAAAIVLDLPPHGRLQELRAYEATNRDTAQNRRTFWTAEAMQFGLGLLLSETEGCDELARSWVERGFRIGLHGHDDPLAASAHRVGRVLPVAIARTAGVTGLDLRKVVAGARAQQDAETRLRRPMNHEQLSLRHVLLTCRRIWWQIDPWDEPTLTTTAVVLEGIADAFESTSYTFGLPAGGLWTGDLWRREDPLAAYVIVLCRDFDGARFLSSEDRAALPQFYDLVGRAGEAARALTESVP